MALAPFNSAKKTWCATTWCSKLSVPTKNGTSRIPRIPTEILAATQQTGGATGVCRKSPKSWCPSNPVNLAGSPPKLRTQTLSKDDFESSALGTFVDTSFGVIFASCAPRTGARASAGYRLPGERCGDRGDESVLSEEAGTH